MVVAMRSRLTDERPGIIRETTDVLVVAPPHACAMDVELRLTSLDPPEGDAHLSGDIEGRAFVGWLGLLHLLWELFGANETPAAVDAQGE